MGVLDTLKQKSKKIAVGVALGGALLGAGSAKANTEEIKDNEAKMEQRADNKSEIKDARKKVGYLDEYLAAIERGENKDEAYRILTLKMADNNQKAAEEMQREVRKVQKSVESGSTGITMGDFGRTLLLLGLTFWSMSTNNKLQESNRKFDALLKSKGIKEND